MNEQEQEIVKTVGGSLTPLAASINLKLISEDPSWYGELSSQDGHSRRHGIRVWRTIWPFCVKRMSCTNEYQPDENRIVAKTMALHSR